MLLTKVKKNYFQDILRLMQIAGEARKMPGVVKAAAAMATDKSKAAFRVADLATQEIENAGGSDLIMAVEAKSEEQAGNALARMEELLASGEKSAAQAPDILNGEIRAVNVGLATFRQALEAQGVSVANVNWRPPAGGNPRLLKLLKRVF
jgi:hypothetical protein